MPPQPPKCVRCVLRPGFLPRFFADSVALSLLAAPPSAGLAALAEVFVSEDFPTPPAVALAAVPAAVEVAVGDVVADVEEAFFPLGVVCLEAGCFSGDGKVDDVVLVRGNLVDLDAFGSEGVVDLAGGVDLVSEAVVFAFFVGGFGVAEWPASSVASDSVALTRLTSRPSSLDAFGSLSSDGSSSPFSTRIARSRMFSTRLRAKKSH